MTDATQNPWEENQTPDPITAANHSHAAASGEHAAAAGSSGNPAQTDPWAPAGNAPDNAADAWSNAPPPAANDVHQNESDWLNAPAPTQEHFDLMDPFRHTLVPLDHWVTEGIDWLVLHFRPLFQGIRVPVDVILNSFQQLLTGLPAPVAILAFSLLAWQVSGFSMGAATLLSLVAIGAIGAWTQAMVTLALVLTALFFCIIVGLPLGIWLAHSDRAARIVRPLLDAMQTTPAFVYLVPIVMLFGIGNVPGVVVTIIFALPPIVRLTILGIRQVPADLVEAAQSFGASPRQMLFKVQLPLAMPTIMAGINQTLMLALSMVVIASMIAVGGLGQMVLRGIGRLDMGLASIGGVGIVILAIILDRLTQSLGRDARSRGNRHWYHHGPLGLLARPFIKSRD
ncbi:glycine betaine/L-proline ABC transporter permease ProW [Dickeya dianthicola]|uniref:glycine betaine/L-proline ABC transporter permease ProW n=1 Tax=Dickeya dianthicola TaxID=204039 RepID=UPI0013715CA7|nr:glycine betaine/L-proline ABC transporter permease ProW [Dickeya dianthicola]MCI4236738.1 glycine betaine/L-proline ABC transporter permease ProW [Dickeya dianthicola]MCI4255050.1 glycine betaine/L-proline ABC transporter permease ProW [Dickeya dianthicola]MZG21552.1 glycine betaine/L-proline ABC transporter permease ProW [Dickeya dianthicola]MZI90514.1 glycine betaine/L-proline ABC transporter permease ProW [Dickeya dianthicola]QOL15711.1 glycine betaine/L-proline ABC transporter permease 